MNIGQTVTFFYKTGKYIGEITQSFPDRYVVKTLAVLTHPKQGDLHNPKETDVPFFHERKALAYREQANIPIKMVKAYDKDIPDYNDSLKTAFTALKSELLSEETEFNQRSLECLSGIKKEYELMYVIIL
ncbi:kinase-associated lipoprotein B [Heyndrickxia acidicola]|uniref:Kinase-associated lipoprotein B n=1 Tax=Heyndrickxia acidicola TaxID=209389 RepID=A0ABU6MNG7_9BACI|nr:kinase-associated lipoprotein B [Heyndrickxia acidicola]MED1205923.1 kinase-associated lipoprotein B [Heyndrickxia acidicola]